MDVLQEALVNRAAASVVSEQSPLHGFTRLRIINGQVWRPTDYLDYLHAADMAYAKLVVTERNLAECIRQAVQRPEVNGPGLAVPLSWLQNAR